MDVADYSIERRENGVLIVKVHSRDAHGKPLPDAVFTFRPHDPQYEYWLKRFLKKETL